MEDGVPIAKLCSDSCRAAAAAVEITEAMLIKAKDKEYLAA